MASMFDEGSIMVGSHLLNLKAIAHVSRADHHAAGKVTAVELISGTKLEFFGPDGDRLWEFAVEGTTKLGGPKDS